MTVLAIPAMSVGRYGLKCHIQSNHGSISFPCDQCEYRSTSKGGFKYHVKSTHGVLAILAISVGIS